MSLAPPSTWGTELEAMTTRTSACPGGARARDRRGFALRLGELEEDERQLARLGAPHELAEDREPVASVPQGAQATTEPAAIGAEESPIGRGPGGVAAQQGLAAHAIEQLADLDRTLLRPRRALQGDLEQCIDEDP